MRFRLLIQTFSAVLFSSALLFATSTRAKEKITVGVTSGPHAQIIKVVKRVAAKQGLEVKIVEFSDYAQPNAMLAACEIDANSFQHLPYLEAQNKEQGYMLTRVADTITLPMGIYSKHLNSLSDLKFGARIAIPNDPTNGGRALLLLQKKGFLTLRSKAGLKATPLDIVDNPKRLKIVERDAAQIPNMLTEVDAAAINTDFALQAKLSPTRDAIALESAKGPYVNVIAVRAKSRHQAWVAKLIKAYQSPEVKHYIEQYLKGIAIPAW